MHAWMMSRCTWSMAFRSSPENCHQGQRKLKPGLQVKVMSCRRSCNGRDLPFLLPEPTKKRFHAAFLAASKSDQQLPSCLIWCPNTVNTGQYSQPSNETPSLGGPVLSTNDLEVFLNCMPHDCLRIFSKASNLLIAMVGEVAKT